MRKSAYLFLSICIALSGCKSVPDKTLIEIEQTEALLFKSVNVFTGKDSVLVQNIDVLIQDGVITNMDSSIPVLETYRIIQAHGKTLMPGLIDAHVHLSGSGAVPWDNYAANEPYNMSAYLYSGITTVYDLGGLASHMDKLSKQVEMGKYAGPDIYHTHIPITVKNSHPVPLTKLMLPWPLKAMVNTINPTIEKPSEAAALIDNYLSKDVDYVKIICDQIPPGSPEMSFEQLEALIQEAHKRGKKVFVHIGSPQNAMHAVKAGADVLAHGVWRGKLSPEQADTIAQAGIPIVYTLAGFHNISKIQKGLFRPSVLDKRLVHHSILDPVTDVKGTEVHQCGVMHAFFANAAENRHFWKDNFKLLHDRNVPIGIGTDSNLPGTYAGSTYFQELALLKAYGLSNFELLKGATFLNSKLFKEQPDFGSVEIGQKANLLLLNGNPLKDIKLLQHPDMIIKKGEIVKRRLMD